MTFTKRTISGTLLSIGWHPRARETISFFPDEVKSEIGYLLFRLQKGERLTMPLSAPMKTVGPGVFELRAKDRSGIYRVFYCIKVAEEILVFHAFVKKTQKTPQSEIELGKKRLKELIED